MILKYPYTSSQYAEFANTANNTGMVLEKQPNGDVWMVSPPPPVPIPPTQEVLDLREKYKSSTRTLCTLAGGPVYDRLSDVEYEKVLLSAMAVDPITSSLLSQTTLYCLMQLYRLDGPNAWENIGGTFKGVVFVQTVEPIIEPIVEVKSVEEPKKGLKKRVKKEGQNG